jgi:hypothetical protein
VGLLMGGHNTLENAQGYHVILGWNLKSIRKTFGVLIYDRQIGRLCINPYRIYDPGTRTILESSCIFQMQSIAIRRTGLSWGGGSCYMWYFNLEVLLLCAPSFLILCPVLRKH